MSQLRISAASITYDHANPRVILVHGAMDRSANFNRVRRRIPDLPVVGYDRRGYAGSVDLGPARDLSKSIADLLSVVGQDPAVVVGHSFGGLIAMGAAHEAPQLINAVGVYEPPMPWEPWWPDPPVWTSPALAPTEFFAHNIGPGSWDRLPSDTRSARGLEGPALIADYASAQRGLPFGLTELLPPVHGAYGTETAPHFQRSIQTIAATVHGASSTAISGASHGVHMTHPDAFAEWVRSVHRSGSPDAR